MPGASHTPGTVHGTPGRLCGGSSHSGPRRAQGFRGTCQEHGGVIIAYKSRGFGFTETRIQVNPCSTNHWLHDDKQALNLSVPRFPTCNAGIIIPTHPRIMYTKHLDQRMSQNKCTITGN